MTPINTIINQYVANPETIDQKQCNIKIVENVTKKIKRGWRNSNETYYVSEKKERIATIESLKTADQNLLKEIIENVAALLLQDDDHIESNIESIMDSLLIIGAEITSKARQIFQTYCTRHLNQAKNTGILWRDGHIRKADTVRSYLSYNLNESLKTEEILKNQQEIIKAQQETIKKFTAQMDSLQKKTATIQRQLDNKGCCVIC